MGRRYGRCPLCQRPSTSTARPLGPLALLPDVGGEHRGDPADDRLLRGGGTATAPAPRSPAVSYDREPQMWTEHGRLNRTGRPHLTQRQLVGREQVVSRCAEDIRASAALLSAPAGYGKTTVLSQWDDADRRPFGWISLDDRHNDPVLLVGSIATALDEIESLDDGVLAPLRTPGPNLEDVVVPRLCEALGRRDHPFVLVLDDVHSLRNPESLRPLGSIAESVPEGSKLALATRDEPAISLGRLRAQRLLLELHAEDLAMTPEEGSALLERAGLELDPRSVEALIKRTEGWPAGLYLAALALTAQHDVDQAVERLLGDDRFIADYLRDEFLAGLPDSDLEFLTRTSILDRLSGSLCDAVLERDGSANVLRRLSRSNLLLVPLDHRDDEYRYHALLREMLASELHRIGETQEVHLHARASEWYAGEGDIDHAVSHAIGARDLELAADLIWAAAPDYASTGREATIRRWLENFTPRRARVVSAAVPFNGAHRLAPRQWRPGRALDRGGRGGFEGGTTPGCRGAHRRRNIAAGVRGGARRGGHDADGHRERLWIVSGRQSLPVGEPFHGGSLVAPHRRPRPGATACWTRALGEERKPRRTCKRSAWRSWRWSLSTRRTWRGPRPS